MSIDNEDRRPTMSDVAAAAGVSTALVSIVMRGVPGASDETRKRVTAVADEIGYIPDRRAQKLRRSRSGQIGVTFELQQPFHGDLVECLYPEAARHGFELVLSAVTPTRDENEAAAALLRERCEAALLLGSRMSASDLDRLAERVPVQTLARASGTTSAGAVRTDDVAGISAAVDELVRLGHRRITHIDGGDAAGSPQRIDGFRKRIASHGLTESSSVVHGGATETDGVDAVRGMFDGGHEFPTAIVAFNDRCAIGVVDALIRRGLDIPGDVSVMGYDDSRLSRLTHVRLSTVAQDVHSMARLAIDQAVRQIAGERPADLILEPTLVSRATTGPAPEAESLSARD